VSNYPVTATDVFRTGTGETAAAETATLSRQIAAVLPDRMRDLATQPYGTWRDILDHLARAARDSRVLLILDEFPELIGSSPALPGILRAFLDDVHEHTQLRIIFSGSAIRTIDEMREYRAPLYGRFDLTLLLHQFRPHEAALMLPDLARRTGPGCTGSRAARLCICPGGISAPQLPRTCLN
jgi:uncharacterized protein